MFCTNCICHNCPYGLKCNICDTWLDGHILIVDGCNGKRECDECPLDYITKEYTELAHAEILREIIRNKDSTAMEAFFDHETGPYHKKERERYEEYLRNLEKKKYENG